MSAKLSGTGGGDSAEAGLSKGRTGAARGRNFLQGWQRRRAADADE